MEQEQNFEAFEDKEVEDYIEALLEDKISEEQIIDKVLKEGSNFNKDFWLQSIGTYISEIMKRPYEGERVVSEKEQQEYDEQQRDALKKLENLQERIRKIIV